MNTTNLVHELARTTGLSREAALEAVEALFDAERGIIARALKRGRKVQLRGFGTFPPRARKARMGHNPRTGEKIRVAASTSVSFRPGKGLRDSVR